MNKKINRSFYVNGKMLRKVLDIREMTQKELSKKLNIAENTVYRIIKYDRMENEDDFFRMCEYLDVNPDLLKEKEYHFKAIQLTSDGNTEHIDEIITVDNIEEFLEDCNYGRSDAELFTNKYIHKFMRNAFRGNEVPEQLETYLFNKIMETRNIFVLRFNDYVMKNGTKEYQSKDRFFFKATIDLEDFYEAFDSWFEKNIKNKRLK